MQFMLESILFKNVDILLEQDLRKGDVFVQNGKIAEFSPSINRSAELELNESGLTLMPGMIDTHVHFRDPGVTHKEDIESGSKAALAAGVTSFMEMPNTNPSTVTEEALQHKLSRADDVAWSNYHFYIGATQENYQYIHNIESAGAIKIFVGSSTGNLLVNDPNQLDTIFKNANKLIAVHSEDESIIRANQQRYLPSSDVKTHPKIRSVEAAIKCTKELVQLAKKHQQRLHLLHITTQEEAEYLATEDAVRSGLVTAEACTPHLYFNLDDYDRLGTLVQVNPPIREQRHQDAIWKAIQQGVIRMISTDHAPHLLSEKQASFPDAPSGMPGVDTCVRLILNEVNQGRFTLNQASRLISASPAQIYQIKNKGVINTSYDADLILVDMKQKSMIQNKNILTRAGWTAFDGMETQGAVIASFVNGQLAYREGDFIHKAAKKLEFNTL